MSSDSETNSSSPKPMKKKIICEDIGDFTKFETILPLEMIGGTEEQKLTLKAIDFDMKNVLPDSMSESELSQDLQNIWQSISKKGVRVKDEEPEISNIKFDFHYRTKNPNQKEPENIDAIITWVNPKFDSVGAGGDEHGSASDSESECEEEIHEYIEMLEKRKAEGFITDEILWYDEDHEITRNLHKDSISLTSYYGDDSNVNRNTVRDFGNSQILYAELTEEEKRMIGATDQIPKTEFSKSDKSPMKFKFKQDLLDQTSFYQEIGLNGSEFNRGAGDRNREN